jgi:quinohemoprotein ethanol dehydrogenase
LLVWVAAGQQARRVDDAAIRRAAPEEWLSHGRDYAETHYSPLKQIDDKNVSRLGLAWTYDTDSAPGSLEAAPLVSNGVMYGSQTWSVLFAIDARTGKLKWKWDPEIPRQSFQTKDGKRERTGPSVCCGPVNRGVALYNGKVYAGLLDGSLAALDAETGRVVWRVQTINPDEDYSITQAPRVVKGKVIVGNSGAEYGVRGFVTAYDAETGRQVWRFYTVPGDPSKGFENKAMEMAAKTWTGEWWKYGGGGTVWDGMAYDPDADLLYIGTGNGSPWNHKIRSPQGGDNLFLSSIVALRPDTGEYVWHYQTTPGDSWDYTAVQPLMLADLRINGRERKVIMQAPKNGFFYVIDRITGEFISGQPFAKNVTWATGIDAKGRPIEAPGARYEKEGFLIAPGPGGAHNWQAMSYNPATGLVYIPGQESSMLFNNPEKFEYRMGQFNTGVPFGFGPPAAGAKPPAEGGVGGAPAGPPPTPAPPQGTVQAGRGPNAEPAPPFGGGFLLAWDPVANKERWRLPVQGAFNSGTLSTAGNLVFTGSGDGFFRAYSADKGEKLWEVRITGGFAQPVTYLLDGKQYISILAGRGNGRVYTFALDGNLPMPPIVEPPKPQFPGVPPPKP